MKSESGYTEFLDVRKEILEVNQNTNDTLEVIFKETLSPKLEFLDQRIIINNGKIKVYKKIFKAKDNNIILDYIEEGEWISNEKGYAFLNSK